MKKNLITFILSVIILNGSLCAFADCFTGFACSIKDLEQNQIIQNKSNPVPLSNADFSMSIEGSKYIQIINNYFDKRINENLFFKNNNNSLSYNDLFIFNTIV
ncbi:MAG: hypothetical protein LUH05_01600 [Candidatus Gastranaerophilales bacterium]|nr:hypothetical protein [Candidatus Gastranaerophilales bacterium]